MTFDFFHLNRRHRCKLSSFLLLLGFVLLNNRARIFLQVDEMRVELFPFLVARVSNVGPHVGITIAQYADKNFHVHNPHHMRQVTQSFGVWVHQLLQLVREIASGGAGRSWAVVFVIGTTAGISVSRRSGDDFQLYKGWKRKWIEIRKTSIFSKDQFELVRFFQRYSAKTSVKLQ